MVNQSLTLERVKQARELLGHYLRPSPLRYSEALSERTGCEVWLKLETLQVTGSFKVRGALVAAEEARRAGHSRVVCYSSGNHARGVAWAARRLGMQATAVMPIWASPVKREAVIRLGATVHLYGQTSAVGMEWAQTEADPGAYFIHPFADPNVIAGQGTAALELLEQAPRPDAVIASASGGGLVGGLGLVLTAEGIGLIAAQPEGSDALARSLAAGKLEEIRVNTRADALTASIVSPLTLDLAKRNVRGFVILPDAELFRAARFLLETEHILVEPGGAAAVAALMSRGASFGRRVVAVVSGGNCHPSDLYQEEEDHD